MTDDAELPGDAKWTAHRDDRAASGERGAFCRRPWCLAWRRQRDRAGSVEFVGEAADVGVVVEHLDRLAHLTVGVSQRRDRDCHRNPVPVAMCKDNEI